MKIYNYLDSLLAKGLSNFSTQQFKKDLSLSKVKSSIYLHRLKSKGKIASPVKTFHVIVTPEYKVLGCLPPELFIDAMMRHLDCSYYVCLLSAAERYGASHHKPQTFQVMTYKKRRDIKCGKVKIEFILRKNLKKLPVETNTVKSGTIKIAVPEVIAFDLVGYQKKSAGLQNVAMVLSELSERLDSKKLAIMAKHSPITWAQRLGYLLNFIGKESLTKELNIYVKKNAKLYTPLSTGNEKNSTTKDKKWKISVNVKLELDD